MTLYVEIKKPFSLIRHIVSLACQMLLTIFILCFSNGLHAENIDTENDWGFDIDLAHQQQVVKKITSKLNTLSLSTSYNIENWDISVSTPFYEGQSDYQIKGIRPRLLVRCDRITSLTAARQQQLINKGKLTQKELTNCETLLSTNQQVNTMNSGIGDVESFVHYTMGIGDETNWSTNIGLGYKMDTGNKNYGFGTGTKDGLFEAGLDFSGEEYTVSCSFGYDMPSGDNSIEEIYSPQNYFYGTSDFSKKFNHWLSMSINFNAQQAYVKKGTATSSSTGYIDFFPAKSLDLHLFATKYLSDKNAPTGEVGASIRYSF